LTSRGGELRPEAFRIGLWLGLFASSLPAVAILAVSWLSPYKLELHTRGQVLDRAGAGTVDLHGELGGLQQICAGPCDDLTFKIAPFEEAYGVCVRNAEGQRLACEDPVYLGPLSATRFVTVEQPKLLIRSDLRGPFGAWREAPWSKSRSLAPR
jgi:hypothetical protein